MSLPDQNAVEKALHYLAETDEKYARFKARVKALEHQAKVIKGLTFLETTGTVAERSATADSCQTFRAFIADLENAVYDMEATAAKRKRAELTIDLFRTIEASRRAGS